MYRLEWQCPCQLVQILFTQKLYTCLFMWTMSPFFWQIPRVRTQVENEKFLTFVTLETTQKAGSENHGDHCQAVEAPDCKHQHLFQPKSDRVLCMPCYSCFERMVMLISTSGVYILHAGEYYGAQGQIGPRNHRSLQNGFGPRRATWC